jgi:hypothetical protein
LRGSGARREPAFTGPVATVIENLEDLSIDEVIEQFDVTREQVTARFTDSIQLPLWTLLCLV